MWQEGGSGNKNESVSFMSTVAEGKEAHSDVNAKTSSLHIAN